MTTKRLNVLKAQPALLFSLTCSLLAACSGGSSGSSPQADLSFNKVGIVDIRDTRWRGKSAILADTPQGRNVSVYGKFVNTTFSDTQSLWRSYALQGITALEYDECATFDSFEELVYQTYPGIGRVELYDITSVPGSEISAGSAIGVSTDLQDIGFELTRGEGYTDAVSAELSGLYNDVSGYEDSPNFPEDLGLSLRIPGDEFPAYSSSFFPELSFVASQASIDSMNSIAVGDTLYWEPASEKATVIAWFESEQTVNANAPLICRLRNDGAFTLTESIRTLYDAMSIEADFDFIRLQQIVLAERQVNDSLMIVRRTSTDILEF